jgi:hypothetical protein
MNAFLLERRATLRAFWLSLCLAVVAVWVETQLDERTALPLLPMGQFLRTHGLALPFLVIELLFAVVLVRTRRRWSEKGVWKVLRFFCQLGFVFCCVLLGELVWDSIFLPIYDALGVYRYAHLFVPSVLLLVVFLTVTGAVFWRWTAVQQLTLAFIRLYLHCDPGGYWYYRFRWMIYRLTRRSTPAPRFVGVLESLVASETALLSHDLQTLEIYTRNCLAASPADVTASFDPAATIKVALRLSQHRQALARHVAPDYASETTSAQERIKALHQWLENWLMACRLNRLVDSSAANADFFRQQALLDCKRQQAGLPAASPERPLIDFLIGALQSSPDASTPLSDDLIQAAEASLLSPSALSINDELEQAWIRLGLEIWVECLACRQDFQAVVHFCTRFVRSPYGRVLPLAQIAYERLGYAWWDYAQHVPEADYRSLAWRQAMHSLVLGHCLQPLEMLAIL